MEKIRRKMKDCPWRDLNSKRHHEWNERWLLCRNQMIEAEE